MTVLENVLLLTVNKKVNGIISSESQAGCQIGVNFKPENKVSQLVALEGKVRIRVIGKVNKFDYFG